MSEALLSLAGDVVKRALQEGIGKDLLLSEIDRLLVEASDAEMHREFPGEKT